ncbi:oligosaccharide flippase family protein [Scytonema sp. PCC 10023]|uniref:oligosaccharide flippase family protein n=1 Tax=Scytonema sp. PCC 10023 TaxID=1680591 RepID=UPI0039C691FF
MATVLANNSFLKNGFYNAVGGVVRIGLAVLTIPVLIRILGVEEYGLWTLASAVMSMVGLAEGGLSTATTVFVSKDLATEDTDGLSQTLTITFGAMLILATLAAIALWIGAESIVSLFPKLEQLQQLEAVQALKIGGLAVWARLLQQVLIGVEQAYQRYGLLNILNTMQWVLISLGLFSVAWQGGRTVALMQWQALTSVAVLLSHFWVVRSLLLNTRIRLTCGRERGLTIARYSLMTWLTSLGGMLFLRGDRLIVGALLGSSTLGVYAAVVDVTGSINTFSALPVQPLLSTLSYLLTKQSSKQAELQQKIKQAVQLNATVALGFGGALLTLTPLVVQVMIPGALTKENAIAFQIATIIYSLYSVNAVGYFILLTVNAVNLCMLNVSISGVLSIILIYIGAINFGFLGATIANVGYIATLLLPIFAMQKLSLSNIFLVKWLKFPFIWFLIIIIINIELTMFIDISSYSLIGLLLLAALQSVVIFAWFLVEQHMNLRLITSKFVKRV